MNAPDRFLTWRWENEEEEERERLKYQSDSKKPNAGWLDDSMNLGLDVMHIIL